ncbi:MAG: hypothetical protein JNK38_27870 [Acidobacteria bacterium]|nr:hypothetical protein [Acidobacteriota bacterium]
MSLQTGTLEITGLTFETLEALNDKARRSGKTAEQYARRLIEIGVSTAETILPEMTLDEAMAPFRRQVEESGLTDEELDEMFLEARRDYHRELKERE